MCQYMCDRSPFVSGHQYWKLRQLTLSEGFPRNISDFGFPSRIKSVDAALHFRNEHYTVFFTGHECWRYLIIKVFSPQFQSLHYRKLAVYYLLP